MSQQTLEPVIVSQLSFLPDGSTPHLPDLNDVDDAVEQTRRLFNHTGSDADLLLKVQAMIAALHKLCLDSVPLGDR